MFSICLAALMYAPLDSAKAVAVLAFVSKNSLEARRINPIRAPMPEPCEASNTDPFVAVTSSISVPRRLYPSVLILAMF